MSLEVKIPKEITQYEAKLVGPFTARQTVWGLLGVVAGWGAYTLINTFVSQDMALTMCLFAALPFLLIGFVKLYEMPFEKFVVGYVKTHMLSPLKRKTAIRNQFAIIDAEMNPIIEDKKVKYKRSNLAFK